MIQNDNDPNEILSLPARPERGGGQGHILRMHFSKIKDIPYSEKCVPCAKRFDQKNSNFCKPCDYGKTCKFAHTWKEVPIPKGYKEKTLANYEEKIFMFYDWGSKGSPLFETNGSNVYCTKLSLVMIDQPDLIGNLCYDFLFRQKCFRWENCWFLHVKPKVLEQLKGKFCKLAGKPTECRARHCPYAHTPDQLKLQNYNRLSPTILNKKIKIFWKMVTMQQEEIDMSYLLQEVDKPVVELCMNIYCDDYLHTGSVHLHYTYWQENPKTLIPIPLPYRNVVKTYTSPKPGKAWGNQTPILEKKTNNTSRKDYNYPVLQSKQEVIPFPAPNPTDILLPNGDTDEDWKTQYLNMNPSELKWTSRRDCALHLDMKGSWTKSSIRYEKQFEEMVNHMQFRYIGRTKDSRFLFHGTYKIGEGGSSTIYLGLKEDDGAEIAVKVFKIEEDEVEENENEGDENDGKKQSIAKVFQQEISALKTRNSVPGVVHYYGNSTFTETTTNDCGTSSKTYRCIALALMECSLSELVTKKWQSMLGTPNHLFACRFLVGSLLHTLKHLNRVDSFQKSLVHRDIKPDNILIDKWHQVKLIDFGISKEIDAKHTHQTTMSESHTYKYAPPEATDTDQSSCSIRVYPTSDLFSLGLVTYYALTGCDKDWGKYGSLACTQLPLKLQTFPGKAHKSYAASHFISNLVQKNPNKRAFRGSFSATDDRSALHDNLLRHPFFWEDRKSINFLVALGNLSEPYMTLLEEMDKFLPIGKSWWQLLAVDFWEANKEKMWNRSEIRKDKISFSKLFRFIRNCYTHSTDSKIDSKYLHTEPYFLYWFPWLVVEAWFTVLSSELLRTFPTLRSIVEPVFYPDSFIVPEGKDWF